MSENCLVCPNIRKGRKVSTKLPSGFPCCQECFEERTNPQKYPKVRITQDELKDYSSMIAEKEHHKNCKFACCGEHSDFFDEDHKVCPKCGMTEEQQDQHNDHVWEIIDQVEANVCINMEVLEDV